MAPCKKVEHGSFSIELGEFWVNDPYFTSPTKKLAYLERITLHDFFFLERSLLNYIILVTQQPDSFRSDPNCLKDERKKAVSRLRLGLGRSGGFDSSVRMVQVMM